MKATILDLRRRMGEVLKALDRNERVTIFHRGKPKAVLHPIPRRDAGASSKDHGAFGMWSDHEAVRDVDSFVRGLRQGRVHVD